MAEEQLRLAAARAGGCNLPSPAKDRANQVFNPAQNGLRMQFCAACHTPASAERKLLRCSKCRGEAYCSRECQKKMWPQHKLVCTPEATLELCEVCASEPMLRAAHLGERLKSAQKRKKKGRQPRVDMEIDVPLFGGKIRASETLNSRLRRVTRTPHDAALSKSRYAKAAELFRLSQKLRFHSQHGDALIAYCEALCVDDKATPHRLLIARLGDDGLVDRRSLNIDGWAKNYRHGMGSGRWREPAPETPAQACEALRLAFLDFQVDHLFVQSSVQISHQIFALSPTNPPPLFHRANEQAGVVALKLIRDAASALRKVEPGGAWEGADHRLVALMLCDAATKSAIAYQESCSALPPGVNSPQVKALKLKYYGEALRLWPHCYVALAQMGTLCGTEGARDALETLLGAVTADGQRTPGLMALDDKHFGTSCVRLAFAIIDGGRREGETAEQQHAAVSAWYRSALEWTQRSGVPLSGVSANFPFVEKHERVKRFLRSGVDVRVSTETQQLRRLKAFALQPHDT